MRARVSVVTATYNRQNLLLRAIRSLKAQTFGDWELCLVNDGGSPLAKWIREEVADPRITLHEAEKNRGQVVARNLALDMAEGMYIACLDDDDTWYPWHLEHLVRAQERTEGLWYADAELVQWKRQDAEHWQVVQATVFALEATAKSLRTWNTLIPSSVLYPLWLHRDLGPFDPEMGDYWDWDWFLRAVTRVPLERLAEVTVQYGLTGDGQSAHPERMRGNLDRLCRKHHLGDLPSANFALLPQMPALAGMRRPTRLPASWHGSANLDRS